MKQKCLQIDNVSTLLRTRLDGLIWSSLLFLRKTLLNVITAVSINTYVSPEGRVVYSIPVQYQLLGES